MAFESLPGLKLFELKDRVAIVTGGSKGLGLAMGQALASAGAHIILVNRKKEEGQEAADFIAGAYGVKTKSISGDVTSQLDMESMAEIVLKEFGKIDILINSAGINIRGPIDELTLEEFKKVMDVNVTGTWLACKAVIPAMKKAKSGKIINLASTLGLVGLANRTPYTSSKGAVVQMTRALGLELAPFNINVNGVCPGPFLTEMNIPIADSDEAKNFIVGATALGRWGKLEEIQGIALYLASDAASYMVGELIAVDGGWVAK